MQNKIMEILGCLKKPEKEKQEEKVKEEKEGNEEKSFFTRQHCIGTTFSIVIAGIIATAFLVYNSYAYYKLRFAYSPNDVTNTPELTNMVVEYKDLYTLNFRSKDHSDCVSCSKAQYYFKDTYTPTVHMPAYGQQYFQNAYSVTAIAIWLDQVGKLIAVGLFIRFGTNIKQIYVSLFSIVTSSNFHADEVAQHMLKYANRQPERVRKIAFYGLIVWSLVHPLIMITALMIYVASFSDSCDSKVIPAVSDQLIILIKAVIAETKMTEQSLFGFNIIEQIQYLNKTLTVCSASNGMSYIFEDPVRIITFGLIAKAILMDIKLLIDYTCARSCFVSHYTPQEIDSVQYLIAVPNYQPKKKLRYSMNGKEFNDSQIAIEQKDNQNAYPIQNQSQQQKQQIQMQNYNTHQNQQQHLYNSQPYHQNQQQYFNQNQQYQYGYNNQIHPQQQYQQQYYYQSQQNQIQYKTGHPQNVIY